MSQRSSGFERMPLDSYATPSWVTEALVPHLPEIDGPIWEPAAGSGQMVAALKGAGFDVVGSDIVDGVVFLNCAPREACAAVITNPPYALAAAFIEHAIEVMRPCRGTVAMLLRTDYDHAKTRQHLFEHPFAKKVVLTKRIVWFVNPDPKKNKSPSFNHAWFIWDWQHRGPPTLAYSIAERRHPASAEYNAPTWAERKSD
jgi:hypothetical protein